jgi:predicted dehydrogenase
MNPVKLAVIGAGVIGSKHASLVAANSGCSLVGICDVDPNRRSIATELKVPFYQEIEDLIEREGPEGAIVSTPNGDHASVSEVCARRSVHVLIEKPIADSVEGADRIVNAADDAGVQVLVGHHRRHSPLIQEARSIVKGGALGRLVAVSMLWALMKPGDYFDADWRRRRPGGGPLLINLIHELDILRFICGEVRQVYAQSSSDIRKLEVEDSLTISLSFDNGALGSVLASDTTPSPWSYEATTHENPYYFPTDENCYQFLGDMGSLAFPRMELWRYADGDQSGWQHPMSRSRRAVPQADPLTSQLEHFCRVIREAESPIVDGPDATRSLKLAFAVLDSIRRQAPVVVDQS